MAIAGYTKSTSNDQYRNAERSLFDFSGHGATAVTSRRFSRRRPGLDALIGCKLVAPFKGCCNGDQTLEVFLNGFLVGTVASVSGQVFTAESIIGVTLLASNTIQFLGTVAADDTAFIDNVSVTTTPLPAALPLFAGGLGMIGLLARRRKQKNAAVA